MLDFEHDDINKILDGHKMQLDSFILMLYCQSTPSHLPQVRCYMCRHCRLSEGKRCFKSKVAWENGIIPDRGATPPPQSAMQTPGPKITEVRKHFGFGYLTTEEISFVSLNVLKLLS